MVAEVVAAPSTAPGNASLIARVFRGSRTFMDLWLAAGSSFFAYYEYYYYYLGFLCVKYMKNMHQSPCDVLVVGV